MFVHVYRREQRMSPKVTLDRGEIRRALGAQAGDLFLKFAEPLPSEALRNMALDVDRYLLVLKQMLELNEFIDIDLANRVASACMELLKQCDPGNLEQTALTVGAVRYFVYPYDAQDDLESVGGFQDDASVVNFVIRKTGLCVPLVRF